MIRRSIKLSAAFLAALMFVTSCAGPQETGSSTTTTTTDASESTETSAENTTTTTDEPTNEELVEISVMVYDRGDEYSSGNSLTDNVLTRWINEQMQPEGVEVTFVPVARSGADAEVNLMLAGEIAPDVIRTYDRQRVSGYASQGGLVDLAPHMDVLADDYLENNTEAIEFTQFNGGQYAIPGVYAYRGKSHETFLRKDLVEKAGMEMPSTRDELIEVLYAVQENFPEITPYAFSGEITDANYTNFVLSYTSRANERDNYIYEPTFTITLKPGHKDGLKQLNQFVLDGIISPDFIMDVDGALYEQSIANGTVGFVMDGSDASIDEAYETASDPDYNMVAIDTIENVDGNYDVPSQDAFSHYVYVPMTATDRIDAVMQYLAFLSVEENAIQVSNGVEGYGFDRVDGIPVARQRDERIAAGTTPNPNDSNLLIANFSYNADRLVENYITANPEVPEEVSEGKIEHQYSHWFDKTLIPAALETDQYVPLLQTLIVEFVFKVMSAPEGQFDQVYETEYQILVDNHLEEMLADRAAWYDENIG